ncbi:choice-of-anchor D domain-containing protein [Wenzhouxiangella sp. EGI_FJ10409]|uniref:choice-of-anchor D domain-containing protein n=1 Tax=Wenzhouxiangella sp. EGI_FJ10409 TaxID=3243767 RepID=UPI0035E1DCFE
MRDYVRLFTLLLVAGCLTSLLPADARAQSEVVVQPGSLSGWTVAVSPPDSGASFDFVSGPGVPPQGSGSLGAEISNSGTRVVLMRSSAPYSGQTVSGLNALSITTYNDEAGGSSVADGWYVDLYIDSENNGIPDCRLHQAAPQPSGDTWATYDLLDGTWTGFNNIEGEPGCEGFSGTLSDFAAASPNALFLAFPDASEPVVRVSVGNADTDYVGYRGNLDSVTISHSDLENLVWDFEPLYRVGGTVSGLSSGSEVELALNGSQLLAVDSPGAFEFPDGFLMDSDYEVTVETQPDMPQQICTVTNGSGTLVDDDADDVQVDCTTLTFTVGGTVSGLAGDQVVLQNNGGDDQVLNADGSFTFAPQDDGSGYDVAVAIQPADPAQTCSVANGSGTLTGADVTDVEVTCTNDQFTVGGTVSGLEGDQVVLQNNGGDDQVVTADGGFTFTAQDDGTDYSISVLTQPEDPIQTCTVANGEGTLSGADVTDVQVDCANEPPAVELTAGSLDFGAVLDGETGAETVTLSNTGTGDLVISELAEPDMPFAVTGGSCTAVPVTLLPGESCEIAIEFTAASASGAFSDEVAIVSNAASSPDTITLSGSAQPPALPVPVLGWHGLLLLILLVAGLALRRGRLAAG